MLRRQSPSLDAGVGRHGFNFLTAPTRALRLEVIMVLLFTFLYPSVYCCFHSFERISFGNHLHQQKRNCHHKFFECRWERRSDLHTFLLSCLVSLLPYYCAVCASRLPRIDLSLSRAYPLLNGPPIGEQCRSLPHIGPKRVRVFPSLGSLQQGTQGKRESTARAFWTSLLHRPRATYPNPPTHSRAFPRLPITPKI